MEGGGEGGGGNIVNDVFFSQRIQTLKKQLENMFVKHYAPNNMPDPKREWSLKENN